MGHRTVKSGSAKNNNIQQSHSLPPKTVNIPCTGYVTVQWRVFCETGLLSTIRTLKTEFCSIISRNGPDILRTDSGKLPEQTHNTTDRLVCSFQATNSPKVSHGGPSPNPVHGAVKVVSGTQVSHSLATPYLSNTGWSLAKFSDHLNYLQIPR